MRKSSQRDMLMIDFKNLKKIDFSLLIQKNNLISYFLIILTFSLDRVSKFKIIHDYLDQDRLYINDFVNFDLIWNTGIGFGLLSSNSSFIYHTTTFTIGLIISFLFYLMVKNHKIDKFFYSLILGGGLGNFYDRSVYLAVPDFIDIHYNNFHWFTFNIADIFITVGIIMLLSKEIFKQKR